MKVKLSLLIFKNKNKITAQKQRTDLGLFASVIGIIVNLLLFGFKWLVGTMSLSVSITADAFNNLSDAGSSIVTFVSYQLSKKPADKEHPFGHGRIEYVASLVVSFIILYIGINLMLQSYDKIANPEHVIFSLEAFAVVFVSILTKIWLSRFQIFMGNKINSSTLKATGLDSLSDVIVTIATLISLITSLFIKFPLDGYMGIIVSLFVLKAGYDVAKDSLNLILGEVPDEDLVQDIRKLILSNSHVLGMHDLILHNYGPNRYLASVHVEVRADEALLEIHNVIDDLERQILKQLNVLITMHLDPVEINNEETNQMRRTLTHIVKKIDNTMSIHDFRIIDHEDHKLIIFDIDVLDHNKASRKEIRKAIHEAFNEKSDQDQYRLEIFIDRGYI